MTYEEVVAYIEAVPGFTVKSAAEHTEKLLDILGHPEESLQIIHVAGTNGKGSVCAFLNSVYQKGGYRTGMFTSPHLISVRERFQIDGVPVDEAVFVSAFEEVMRAVRKVQEEGEMHPAYFELLFLMGVVIFAKAKVDVLLMETGLGGTKDATNVVKHPLLCVITSISRDHEQYLGSTIPEIASNKAGIIKRNVPVVCDGQDPEATGVILRRAAELHSSCSVITGDRIREAEITGEGCSFLFDGTEKTRKLRVAQCAPYQMRNAALACEAVQILSEKLPVSERALLDGIAQMQWPCRMEKVLPDVVIDGAHNEDGIAEFVRAVQYFHRNREITLLFGAVADKRYPDMIRTLAEQIRPERVVVTRVPGDRAVSEDVFAELFRSCGIQNVCSDPEPGQAFALARSLQGDGMLFCVGSLYLAGELKRQLEKKA